MTIPLPKLNDDFPFDQLVDIDKWGFKTIEDKGPGDYGYVLGQPINRELPIKPAPKVRESDIYHIVESGGKMTVSVLPEKLGPRYAPKAVLDIKTEPQFQVGDFIRLNPSIVSPTNPLLSGRVYGIRYECGICQEYIIKCDPNGWIHHISGDPMPCPGSMQVRVALDTAPLLVGPAKSIDWGNQCWKVILWKPSL